MNKIRTGIIAVLLMCAVLAGCTPKEETPPASSGGAQTDFEAARAVIIEANQDMLGGLTPEQMDEDFEYLWALIRTSYPFTGVAEREGIDVEGIYTRYKENLPKVSGDISFMNYMGQMVAEFGYTGHFDFYNNTGYYHFLRDAYEATAADYGGHFTYLDEVLSDPQVANTYAKLEAVEAEIIALYGQTENSSAPQDQGGAGSSGGDTTGTGDGTTGTGNLETAFYPEYAAAYVKVHSMLGDSEGMVADKQQLLAFYEEATGYDNLIIDITGNGGGSDYYWMQNLAAPLMNEPLEGSIYMLFARTPYTEPYLLAAAGESGEEGRPISELPEFPALVVEDLDLVTGFTTSTSRIEPTGESPYKGRIWLLVDGVVYSSSETFAMFSKATGFATLVGQPTGGDGGGIDPMLFKLPNSGFVGRFSVFYTLNADGGNSEEHGTAPHILSAEGQSPLEACFAAMDAA